MEVCNIARQFSKSKRKGIKNNYVWKYAYVRKLERAMTHKWVDG